MADDRDFDCRDGHRVEGVRATINGGNFFTGATVSIGGTALKKLDLILLAGTLLDFRMRFGQTIPADAKIITGKIVEATVPETIFQLQITAEEKQDAAVPSTNLLIEQHVGK